MILEIHHEMSGFTKILYYFLEKLMLLKNLKYIFIHKNLQKKFKKSNYNSIVLDDGVDLEDFQLKTKTLKSCVYTGSFAPGKGIEYFAEIAKNNPRVKFYAYGNLIDYKEYKRTES